MAVIRIGSYGFGGARRVGGFGRLHERRRAGKGRAACGGGVRAAAGGHAAENDQASGAAAEHDRLFAAEGHNIYIYADAAGCGCAFIGNDAAYQQYQQIRAANNIAQMQETTAILNQEAAMDWGGAGVRTRPAGIDRGGGRSPLALAISGARVRCV